MSQEDRQKRTFHVAFDYAVLTNRFDLYVNFLKHDYPKFIEKYLEKDYLKKYPSDDIEKWVKGFKKLFVSFSNTYRPKCIALEKEIKSSRKSELSKNEIIALRKKALDLFTKAGEDLKEIFEKMADSYSGDFPKRGGIVEIINSHIENSRAINIYEDELYDELDIPDLKK